MKIEIDSTWGNIYDAESGRKLFHSRYAIEFQSVLNKILTPSQLYKLADRDGIFTLSDKKTKIFKQIIG